MLCNDQSDKSPKKIYTQLLKISYSENRNTIG